MITRRILSSINTKKIYKYKEIKASLGSKKVIIKKKIEIERNIYKEKSLNNCF